MDEYLFMVKSSLEKCSTVIDLFNKYMDAFP